MVGVEPLGNAVPQPSRSLYIISNLSRKFIIDKIGGNHYSLDRLAILIHKEVIMGHTWQLQEAKNKFSKLVEKAQIEGPQFVTKHGKESVVVLSIEEYKNIIKPESNLFQFFQDSPLSETSILVERDKSPSRDIDL